MINKALFSSNTPHWSTPKELYDYFMIKGFIDPCPLNSQVDNLDKIYTCSKLYINPPFCDLDKWTEFVINNSAFNLNNEIVLLMPARTDTVYFHKLLGLHPKIFFIKGRLRFGDSNKPAPFPTILLYFTQFKSLNVYCGVDIKSLK